MRISDWSSDVCSSDLTGRAVISSDPTLGDHEISPFVVDMENEGRLSERGRFRPDRDDLRLLVEHHLPAACKLWKLGAGDSSAVAADAPGGLPDEDAAANTARTRIPRLYSDRSSGAQG